VVIVIDELQLSAITA